MMTIMKRIAVVLAVGVAVTCVFGAASSMVVPETEAVSHMESRNRQPGRGDGIFGDYWWANRFLSRYNRIMEWRGKTVDVVMLGDSIVHFWEWHHPESWAKFCDRRRVLNLGYGGDRTQQVIWRIENGELDGYTAKNVVLLIGTNNNSAQDTKPENVVKGIAKIVAMIRAKQPKANVVLMAIFPRGRNAESKLHAAARGRNDATNVLLKEYAAAEKIVYLDINARLVDESGWVPETIMKDEVHPTAAGYDIWMEELSKVVK